MISSALSRQALPSGVRSLGHSRRSSPGSSPPVCPKFPARNSQKGRCSQRFQCSLGFKSSPSPATGQRFQLEDVIEAQQFDREILTAIFEVARGMERIEKGTPESEVLRGHLMATLFYEPSTRTRLSFESAMKRLGGEVLTTENAREFSSAAKGETLEGPPVSPSNVPFLQVPTASLICDMV